MSILQAPPIAARADERDEPALWKQVGTATTMAAAAGPWISLFLINLPTADRRLVRRVAVWERAADGDRLLAQFPDGAAPGDDDPLRRTAVMALGERRGVAQPGRSSVPGQISAPWA